MKNNVDNFERMLEDALIEEGSLSADLINETRGKLHNKEIGKMKLNNKRPLKWAAAVVIGLLLTGITALATWQLLTPSEVADEFGREELRIAFDSEDALHINESIISEGYIFTLMSIVSGEDLTDMRTYIDGYLVRSDRTYAVIAIEKEDGTSMTESASSFFISPYIRGFAPWQVNIARLGGGHLETFIDGVLYRLIDMENIEIFADHGVYLGMSLGIFSFDAIDFDAETGAISLNPDFNGPSVLFELPLDSSLADEERVQEILVEFFYVEEEDVEIDEVANEEEEFVGLFDCTAEFERFEGMTDDDFYAEFLEVNRNYHLNFEDKQAYCTMWAFRRKRGIENGGFSLSIHIDEDGNEVIVTRVFDDMEYTLMSYDEFADFLEARIEMHIEDGEPEGVIVGARRDREDWLRTMREYNIEFAEVYYCDDFGYLSISLTNPDYADEFE